MSVLTFYESLTNIFNDNPVISELPRINYPDEYVETHLDLLLQQGRRSKGVKNNKLLDFIQFENDPNFSRRYLENQMKYSKIIGQISGTQQIITTVQSMLSMSGVYPFIPENIKSFINKFRSLSDAGINLLPVIQQGITFKQIEQLFLRDITIHHKYGKISLSQVILMYDRYDRTFANKDSVKNNPIRTILSLGLERILPSSMTSILGNLQYIDKLREVFFDSISQYNIFNDALNGKLYQYGGFQISNIVKNSSDFENKVVDIHDPLGLVAQDQMNTEIQDNYSDYINQVIPEIIKENNLNVSIDDMNELIEIVTDNGNKLIDESFDSGVGLPSLTTCVDGVSISNYNAIVAAIKNMFQLFANDFVLESSVPIKTAPAKMTPVDHLMNIKRNLIRRKEMTDRGVTPHELEFMNAYFRNEVFSDGILSEEKIDKLYQEIVVVADETQ